jgi:hypothetical protein
MALLRDVKQTTLVFARWTVLIVNSMMFHFLVGLFFIISIACLAYLKPTELFSNHTKKDREYVFGEDGDIMGLDLVDHEDTFDYEPVELETQIPGAEIGL